jgi:hypothetical protein
VSESKQEPPRKSTRVFSDQDLIDSALYVAKQLGTNVLSGPMYKEYQMRHAPQLPSESLVRKKLGNWRWSLAMEVCGLKAPDRSTGESPDPAQIVRALQLASRGRSLMEPMTQNDYNRFCAAHKEERLPDLMQVLDVYGTWEQALHAASIELEDDMHSSGWTIYEARSALEAVLRFTGAAVTRSSYERTRAWGRREMPTFDDLIAVLDLGETPDGGLFRNEHAVEAASVSSSD